MEISSIFIGVALLAVSVVYVSRPFRQKWLKTTGSFSAYTTQERQREAIVSALRELDFDFKTGKISEEDYIPLRTQLVAEAAQYIEAEEDEAEQLESLIRTRRAAQQKLKCGSAIHYEQCPSCEKKIRAGDLFCSSCGKEIQIQMEVVARS